MKDLLHILLVDDEEVVHQTLSDYLHDLGHVVEGVRDGYSALQILKDNYFDLALVDIRMPGIDGISLLDKIPEIRPEMPIVIITGHGSMESAIQALRLGAADFLTKPIKLLELDAVLEKCVNLYTLRREKSVLQQTIKKIQYGDIDGGATHFIGVSASAIKVRKQIEEAVDAGCETILITGETGVGKEVAASEIHNKASNAHGPFIPVCCPALPETLLESAMFGHVRGAFTGAHEDRAGYFEMADGGTLFLDDIGDLSLSAQASILRVMEARTFRRVGGLKEIKVALRVVAATNIPLENLVREGRFRRDLFYRLNVYTIHIPPIRERKEDIMPLAEHFLNSYASMRNLHFQGFSDSARNALMNYDYPGNARELRNMIELAAIQCRSGMILPEHIRLQNLLDVIPISPAEDHDKGTEKSRILKALEDARWNRRLAAQKLDMPYSTLRYKLKNFGIT
ncbi:sigma-54-dependent Fis family transcriptional regulator [Candidatus Sumerlaeota bacterium]|nr:sigma-54-dependent Fis family transcriptional regulator [Candidatus Sumerlaeota bacterium]